MQTVKVSRFAVLILAAVLALFVAACSPTASPTSAPSGGEAAGDPAAAAKSFYDTLYAGGDVSSMICAAAGVDAATLQEAYSAAAAAFANATIDTSGMTFTAANVTETSANVEVAGSMSVETGGQTTSMDVPPTSMTLAKENGAWKICG